MITKDYKLGQMGPALAAPYGLETLVLHSFSPIDTYATQLALALKSHASLRHLHVMYLGEASAQGLRMLMALPNLQTFHVCLSSSVAKPQEKLVESIAQEMGVDLELTRW
ncbi:Aste57867_19735 [Aphanomyces stellatus]|uniref:Aste57867_19735 protein n=1 Tax=Aphanomyces stellatus TaxID=120398 RepID=A0A485LDS9_9STRA|nr:hypothetical protein As57867_019670 [Aphanomyces stellatus]VFT96433.1 Aste57867_19735 [Aphanomyces stellatus]